MERDGLEHTGWPKIEVTTHVVEVCMVGSLVVVLLHIFYPDSDSEIIVKIG